MEVPIFKKHAYAVFKGGGVAGMAHVGALQELEKTFDFVGYAGTSAGSLVALLAAAGLSADQMRDALETLELKSLVGVRCHLIPWVPWVAGFGAICFVAWPLTWLLLPVHHLPAILGWILAVISLIAATMVGYFTVFLGMVPKKRLQDFLIKQVRKNPKFAAFDENTTFAQFSTDGAKPLVVFTTDLARKVMQPLDKNHDQGRIKVVEAVIASAAFPLFFFPGDIEGRCTTDGGIACNLPVFAFDHEVAGRRIPVFAMDLEWTEHPREGRLLIVEFLTRLISTAVESNYAMITRNLRAFVHPIRIVVPEGIDVMDFTISKGQRDKLFASGTAAAQSWRATAASAKSLDSAETEREYTQAQYAPAALIVPLLDLFCREAEEILDVEDPRAAIFMEFSNSVRKIAYHTFADTDPDVDIPLGLFEGVTGYAWKTGEFVFGHLPGQNLDPAHMEFVKKDRRSAFCAPLFDPYVVNRRGLVEQSPFGVLVLDSSSGVEELGWATNSAKAEEVRDLGLRWADTFSKLLQ